MIFLKIVFDRIDLDAGGVNPTANILLFVGWIYDPHIDCVLVTHLM